MTQWLPSWLLALPWSQSANLNTNYGSARTRTIWVLRAHEFNIKGIEMKACNRKSCDEYQLHIIILSSLILWPVNYSLVKYLGWFMVLNMYNEKVFIQTISTVNKTMKRKNICPSEDWYENPNSRLAWAYNCYFVTKLMNVIPFMTPFKNDQYKLHQGKLCGEKSAPLPF